jgi:uncharacterized protein YkwD
MRTLIVAFVLALTLAGTAAGLGSDELAPVTRCRIGSPTQMWCQHNYVRGQNGLQPVYRDPELYLEAQAKLHLMQQCGEFSHTPCGEPFSCGVAYFTCGENIACGYLTVRATMAAWLLSPGHRANILTSYFHKYGSAFNSTGLLTCPRVWVVKFGTPIGSPDAQGQPPAPTLS